jgi:hypothetical protein
MEKVVIIITAIAPHQPAEKWQKVDAELMDDFFAYYRILETFDSQVFVDHGTGQIAAEDRVGN